MAEIIDMPTAEESLAFARDYLEDRFRDVRQETYGWSALCPCCDSETRIQITRELKIESCANGHTSGQVMDATAPKEPSAWGFISAADLLAEDIPETRWLYRRLIPANSVSVIFSQPNAGKTFLALHICAEVAVISALAGYSVHILEYEGTRKAMQTRLRRALKAAGADPGKIAISHNPPLLFTEHSAELAEECKGSDLILIDSLSAAVGDDLDENDSVAQGAAAAALKGLQVASGASVAALTHMTKAAWAPGERPTLASLRGHSKLHGRIDTAIALVGGETDPTQISFELHVVKQRESERGNPLRYTVGLVGEEATVTVEEIEGKQEQAFDGLLLEVLKVVREAGHDGASKNQIEKGTKGKNARKRQAIQALCNSGEIETIAFGLYERFRLAPSRGRGTANGGEPGKGVGSPLAPFIGEGANPTSLGSPHASPRDLAAGEREEP